VQLLASEEYGLRCLLQVARAEGAGPVPVGRVARAEGLSPEYAAKLLRRLRLAGLLSSVRGAEGGYRLTRPVQEISVWSALAALGGEFFDTGFCGCHPGRLQRCVRSRDCSLRPLWRRLQDGLRRALEGVSLGDLQRDERAMAAWLDTDGEPLIRIEGVRNEPQ
jgi:Rrf2 family protein